MLDAIKEQHLLPLPPLGLYIHIPWCTKKCPYCDFNSHPLGQFYWREYLAALVRDLDVAQSIIGERAISTLFIGGGTPSLFPTDLFVQLMCELRKHFVLATDWEATIEVNPGSVDQEKLAIYREAGINRLSIGVQSFARDTLASLGRIHNDSEAIEAIIMAQEAGIWRVNIDLMYGCPGQSTTMALHDLGVAIALKVPHISWYQLTIEPNTAFHHNPPVLPPEGEIAETEQAGRAQLASAGWQRYEVSAYAQTGAMCRHNLNYWRFGDYIGLGAGAHGKLTDWRKGTVRREVRRRSPLSYIEHSGQPTVLTDKSGVVSLRELPFEFMLNVLRLTEGFEPSLFAERTGTSLAALSSTLDMAVARGLLLKSQKRIKATPLGQEFLNDLTALFLLESSSATDVTP